MRDYLASKSATFLADNIKDFTYLSEILSKRKKQQYKLLDKQEVKDIFNYAFQALYGETIKMAIIFAIAYFLNILLPVVLITLTFATLRTCAGGVHMDTFMKCFITTAIMFLVPGYLLNHMGSTIVFSNIGLFVTIFLTFIFCLDLALEYAPRDTETKEIKDPKEIKKYKDKTIKCLIILSIEMLAMLVAHYFKLQNMQLVILSICTGMLLEIFTITPLGVRTFHGIRDYINGFCKVNKVGEKEC